MKKKIHIEYTLPPASSTVLWNAISTPSGLEHWFADKVLKHEKDLYLPMGENRNAQCRNHQPAHRIVCPLPLERRRAPHVLRAENPLQRTDERPLAGSDRLCRCRRRRRCHQLMGLSNRDVAAGMRHIILKIMQNIVLRIIFYATFAS